MSSLGSDVPEMEYVSEAPSIPAPVRRDPDLAGGQFSLISDVGLVRDVNEDSAYAMLMAQCSHAGGQPLGVFAVADGMGGHEAGEQASLLAVQTCCESLMRQIILPVTDPSNSRWSSVPVNEAMDRAYREAHRRVLQEVPRGATTLTAVLLMGRRAHIGHIGDCRVYVVRERQLARVTQDHSLLNRLLELEQLEAADRESLSNDPRRNVLYRAIGQGEESEMDFSSCLLSPGEGLLMCSDGLWGSMSEDEIHGIILGSASTALACRALVDAANAHGGPDNITAILVHPIGM